MPDRFRFRGQVYRAPDPRWVWQPESGEGACIHGGRFNPPGMPALYTSADIKTAWLEAQQGFAFKPQPLTLCAYQVDCEDILDLTDSVTLRHHELRVADLALPWRDQFYAGTTPLTHRLANRLIAENIAGVIVPSFTPGVDSNARNLVFWNWSRQRPHQVCTIDDQDRLAKPY